MKKRQLVFVLPIPREQLTVPIDPVFHAFFKERLADGNKVAFEFRGYDEDSRELYEVPEVCIWLRALFLDAMPEALKTLADAPPGRLLVEACCNITKRNFDGKVTQEVRPAWVSSCLIAGISP